MRGKQSNLICTFGFVQWPSVRDDVVDSSFFMVSKMVSKILGARASQLGRFVVPPGGGYDDDVGNEAVLV